MAPMVPFISEQVWQKVLRPVNSALPESVHLADFPIADSALIDQALMAKVATTRRIVELGRAARATSQVKIRQPLARALVAGYSLLDIELQNQIADELNVHRIEDISQVGSDLVTYAVKANFRNLGARYGAAVQEAAKAISGQEPGELVRAIRSSGKLTIGNFDITADDLVITETPKSGWAVASHDGESVALDLELTPQLITEGFIREVIRVIQEERKRSGLHVSDRIHIRWNGDAEIVAAFNSGGEEISQEVLALSLTQDSALTLPNSDSEDDQLPLALQISKA